MKKSKRIISMILAVIMLTMTAIGVNAEELIVGTTDLLIELGMIDPSPEEELMPMAATGCNSYPAYPPEDGFLNGEYTIVTLPAGTTLKQYYRSYEADRDPSPYYCDMDAEPSGLTFPPLTQEGEYLSRTMTLTEPTQFKVGTVAPWGGCYNGMNSGGGTQYLKIS